MGCRKQAQAFVVKPSRSHFVRDNSQISTKAFKTNAGIESVPHSKVSPPPEQ